MKVNELRIGNLVSFNGSNNSIGQVTAIKKALITGLETVRIGFREDKLHKLSDIKPIPITEERLLKFGFKRFPWGLVKGNLLFKDDLKCSNLILQVGNGFNSEIKYVHQLQNLYFALTGEELTIKNQEYE